MYAISDRFTVLRNGKLVGEYEAATLPRLELIGKMIGKDIATVEQMTHQHAADVPLNIEQKPVFVAERVSRRGAVEPTDLSINRGEVVGLAGLLGSGRTELARLFFGVDRADGGRITVDGRPRGSARRARPSVADLDSSRKIARRRASSRTSRSARTSCSRCRAGAAGGGRSENSKQRELADKYIRARHRDA